jgi:hypothetical protein
MGKVRSGQRVRGEGEKRERPISSERPKIPSSKRITLSIARDRMA